MIVHYHINDIPSSLLENEYTAVALDTEAMGLHIMRDRMCLVQLCFGTDEVHLVHFRSKNDYIEAVNLTTLLSNEKLLKIFHFARFDVAKLQQSFNISMKNIYCTKIASKLSRTFTDYHGLKSLCAELLGVKLSKTQQTSDWGEAVLTEEQKEYAAYDVLYLHKLVEKLNKILIRDGKMEVAQKCFDVIPTIAALDIVGFNEQIFCF
ncbi:Ribonuclease D [Candidatus Fokinia solitaria]|uniref:Ribonuclease D n=1 Tax=Candidatus Fokinia solitaria TaxID=1802984 RepID=A0A2U8BRC9_9RICK|nr:ribonuclease H-like domain-containing protein [Candidatus Fokinia solitaria]AWD32906.1 Ribonuclease D [Candidatus Fokinia solitaria]